MSEFTMTHPLSRGGFLKTTAVSAAAGCGVPRTGVAVAGGEAGEASDPVGDSACLAHTHDLRLPDWGS